MGKIQPSYQQSLFSDSELPTSQHDKIVRWTQLQVINRPNSILECLGVKFNLNPEGVPCKWDIYRKPFSESFYSYDGVNEKIGKIFDWLAIQIAPNIPEPPPIKFSKCKWEPLVKNQRDTMVGALDLSFSYGVGYLELRAEKAIVEYEKAIHILKSYEYLPISHAIVFDGEKTFQFDGENLKRNPGKAIGNSIGPFILYNKNVYSIYNVRWHANAPILTGNDVYVEAKTKINSVGELLRQINLYRNYKIGKFIVVAPAEAWKDDMINIVSDQGLYPLIYQSNA